jgi:translation initiation factor IF-2
LSLQKRKLKNKLETLEKLQGKGGKSKAAKYRRDKRDTHRQKSDDEQRALTKEVKLLRLLNLLL